MKKEKFDSKTIEPEIYAKAYRLGLSRISNINGRLKTDNTSEWTEKELEKLKMYYPNGGYKECQRQGINKTMCNITSKAALLGIKRINKEEDVNYEEATTGLTCLLNWTAKDVALLKKYYPTGGTSLCQEKGLDKKSSTIRMAAKSLGISLGKKKLWTEEDDKLLKDTFEKYNTKESCYEIFSNRTKTDVNNRLKELNLVLKKRWTKTDVEILKEYFPIGGARLVIEKGVDRSIREIGAKASNLGIKITNSRKQWTKEEEDILKKYYPEEGIDVIKRLKDTDELAIRNKVRYMKLSGPTNKWTDKELDILVKYYPIEGGKIKNRLPNKTMSSIYYRASLLNLKSNK